MKEKAKRALLSASRAVTLKEFAKALAEMKTAEINDLAAVLKEEYGIVPAKFEIKEAAGNVSITKSPERILKRQQSRDYFVPKKMGKVCSKPKKRF